MKQKEYERLTRRMEKAQKNLSDQYILTLRIEHFKRMINGEKCVYVSRTDSRRFPTEEEKANAKIDLEQYSLKLHGLCVQFAAL